MAFYSGLYSRIARDYNKASLHDYLRRLHDHHHIIVLSSTVFQVLEIRSDSLYETLKLPITQGKYEVVPALN